MKRFEKLLHHLHREYPRQIINQNQKKQNPEISVPSHVNTKHKNHIPLIKLAQLKCTYMPEKMTPNPSTITTTIHFYSKHFHPIHIHNYRHEARKQNYYYQ